MKNVFQIFAVIIAIAFFMSCKNNVIRDCFKTKEDSISFAKAVISKYPEAQGPKIADFGNNPNKTFGSKKFNPIDWDKVTDYAANYDKIPLIRNKKGFMIDANGLSLLKANDNYSQVYLRFGKYSNSTIITDDYTVMIIPLDEKSDIICKTTGSSKPGVNSNYDELDPCPRACPNGFE